MRRFPLFLACLLANLAVTAGVLAAPAAKRVAGGKPGGRAALAAVRHDWKAQAHKTVRAKQADPGPLPAHFGRLSPEARLAYLHARRNLNPARFDRFHRQLGSTLATDDRLRMSQSQDCRPLSGLLPNTARTRYLHHRRNLNPVRFDIYHPTLGALLAEDDLLRSGKGCVSPEIIVPPVVTGPQPPEVVPPGTPSPVPPGGGGGGGGPGPGPPPSAVPEPGSLTLILLGSAGALTPRFLRWWKHRPSPESA